MLITELAVLRWLHIIAVVYWLGGEWGVFQTSYNIVNRKLPMDERRRHMETAYRIDILARTGIILLFPLGFHMGYFWGVQPLGMSFLGHGPFNAAEGQKWFTAKALIFAFLLMIGLKLRFVMREWTTIFRQLAEKEDAQLEQVLEKSIITARKLAYLYWVGIGTVAFLGATKPF